MFYGSIEVHCGKYYYNNIHKDTFDKENIVIIENEFIMRYLEFDKVNVMNPKFTLSSWKEISTQCKKFTINVLVFAKGTSNEYIVNMLKKRVNYILTEEGIHISKTDYGYNFYNNKIIFNILNTAIHD